jgi:flagellar motor switch protein FliM
MDKRGLIALAETYRLDRGELQQLKFVAESFFDALRIELASCTGTPIKLGELTQSVAGFKDLCVGASPGRCVFLGSPKRVAALVKADPAFARAIVDCLISGRVLPDTDSRALTTIEQRLFSNTMATACIRSAMRTPAAGPMTDGGLSRIDSALAENIADPAEQFGLARIECRIGSASGGVLELALPLAHFSQPEIQPASTTTRVSMPAENKARACLSNADAELVAVLGQAMLTLDAVRALRRGSILALGPLKDGLPEVELRCENQVLFSGAVVEHRGWRRFLIQPRGVSDERADQRAFDA